MRHSDGVLINVHFSKEGAPPNDFWGVLARDLYSTLVLV